MFAAVILAGGAARRVGGANKPALRVGGRALIGRVLDAVAEARPRIVVGPADLVPMLPTDVLRTRERPPGGGPVAAIAAAVALLPTHEPDTAVAVLASDLPFLSGGAIDALRARLAGAANDQVAGSVGAGARQPPADLAVLVDDGGRPQWLAGVWRLGTLQNRLEALGDPAGRSMRELTDGLEVASVRLGDPAGPPAWFDCDTEDDLRAAEGWARGHIG